MADSSVYIAEMIMKERKLNGITQYYVKWKGYSHRENTWEPVENILDRGLLIDFEQRKSKSSSSSASSSTSSSATLSSSGTSSDESQPVKRGRGRPRKADIYRKRRQEQVRLQRHIEEKQQQKTQLGHIDKKQLVVFNPVGTAESLPTIEEIVYEPDLTKEPIFVTDVTAQDLTVTISECETPEGFFRT